MPEITKQTTIGELLELDSTTAQYFYAMGMGCVGCPSAQGETLQQACEVHGIDCDALIEMLREHLLRK